MWKEAKGLVVPEAGGSDALEREHSSLHCYSQALPYQDAVWQADAKGLGDSGKEIPFRREHMDSLLCEPDGVLNLEAFAFQGHHVIREDEDEETHAHPTSQG